MNKEFLPIINKSKKGIVFQKYFREVKEIYLQKMMLVKTRRANESRVQVKRNIPVEQSALRYGRVCGLMQRFFGETTGFYLFNLDLIRSVISVSEARFRAFCQTDLARSRLFCL